MTSPHETLVRQRGRQERYALRDDLIVVKVVRHKDEIEVPRPRQPVKGITKRVQESLFFFGIGKSARLVFVVERHRNVYFSFRDLRILPRRCRDEKSGVGQ